MKNNFKEIYDNSLQKPGEFGTIFQKTIDDPAILDEIKQDLINNNIL